VPNLHYARIVNEVLTVDSGSQCGTTDVIATALVANARAINGVWQLYA